MTRADRVAEELGSLEGVGEAGRGALKSGDTEHGEYARRWGVPL